MDEASGGPKWANTGIRQVPFRGKEFRSLQRTADIEDRIQPIISTIVKNIKIQTTKYFQTRTGKGCMKAP